MANRRKSQEQRRKHGGPYLASALFCEVILEEKSGALSLVRVFDIINLTIPANAPADFPSEENRLNVPTWALISFKSGDAPGTHKLRIDSESPSGKVKIISQSILELS